MSPGVAPPTASPAPAAPAALALLPGRRLPRWDVEDEAFFASVGRPRARRNLWISVPCLLCAFAVWQYWSVVIVRMQDLGFPFAKKDLYALPAIAGLSGATLRIPNSFLIALAGGRNAVALTTALLLLPVVGAGLALRSLDTSYTTFVVLAVLSGVGGGNFASSMSNISFFFPKKTQGLYLGVNAGIGNLGVSVTQFVLPLVMGAAVFGALGGEPLRTAAGTPVWIQNAGQFWVPVLVVLAVLAWTRMDNLPGHGAGPTGRSLGIVLWLHVLGFAAVGAGLAVLLGLGRDAAGADRWFALPLTIVVAVAVALATLRWLAPRGALERLKSQLAILRDKHTWVMTVLYIMTFGSFIGYSAAFPKLIQDVFGTLPGGGRNPAAPSPTAWAFLGPLVGSLVRPAGGWLSDRFGGARVTQWSTVVMVAAALGAAFAVRAAQAAAAPETWFFPFLGCFLLLFVTTGVGNGSTFRMIPIIFPAAKAGPVLGWTSAVAAYGGMIIPKVFGAQIEARSPHHALYGFAAFYVLCLGVNGWFYARRGAEIRC